MQTEAGEAFNKRSVARSFGRASVSYDAHAELQRDVANHLVTHLVPSYMKARAGVKRILDLGSGTGYCSALLRQRYPSAQIVNLDLSLSMLTFARDKNEAEDGLYVCADAEALPFAADSFDLIFSSLTVQWCRDYPRLFAELKRIARPDAQCCLATFGPSTLRELKQAWATVDSHIHVNDFTSAAQLQAWVRQQAFAGCELEVEHRLRYYPDLQALSRELKAIGAHNMNPGQSLGLTGKQRLLKLKQAFQQGEVEGRGVPVTWEVLYLNLVA